MFDTDHVCWEIVPLQKIKQHWYRCDNKFHLDILYEQTQTHDGYGIVLLSGDESRLYWVAGSNHKLLCTMNCRAPNKQGHGGYSSNRYERLRVETLNEYYKKIHEKLTLHFIDHGSNQPNVTALIFAGPAQTKNKVADHDLFDVRLKKILTRIETTTDLKDETIYDVIHKVSDLIHAESEEVKAVIAQFERSLEINDGLVIYGQVETLYYLQQSLLQYLIISDDHYNDQKESLSQLCEKTGCQLIVTGSNLIKTYGGMAGLAWYPIQMTLNELDPDQFVC